MIIKVCGISTQENIEMLSGAKIDMVGLNFYKPSVRYIPESFDPYLFDSFPSNVKRVGVFVNETVDNVLDISKRYKLDYAQLHGDESPAFCTRISKQISVIKVFRVDQNFDFEHTKHYKGASYFLFDTYTKDYGGSGRKFNWDVLRKYDGAIPFLLSGGIGPEDAADILAFKHLKFVGIDINSKFENKPGIKDASLIMPFINHLTHTSK